MTSGVARVGELPVDPAAPLLAAPLPNGLHADATAVQDEPERGVSRAPSPLR